MQVSVETTQGLERRLTITVPAEKVDTEIKKRLTRLAKTQRIDGFRPGKVPVSVIRQRYGAMVRNEVAAELMQRNYIDALVGEKIQPAGEPQIEQKTNKKGEDLEFVATFEVYPDVVLKELKELAVEQPVVEVNDSDLDKMIETLRKQHTTWDVADSVVEKNEKVTIDFVGTVDGEEFEGGKADDFQLQLGENLMIPDLEDGLIGMNAGDEAQINVTFPEDYHVETLQGKAAVFTVKLHKIETPTLPQVNEEFAKLFGVTEGGVEALRKEVLKNMKRELEQAVKSKLKEQVIQGMLGLHELDIPKALITQEAEALRKQATDRYRGQVDPANMSQLPIEIFHEQAKDRVKISLLLAEFIRTHEVEVDDSQVHQLIESMASAYESPEEVIEYYKNDATSMKQMQNVALEQRAIELLVEKASVTDVETTFDEIMNTKQQY